MRKRKFLKIIGGATAVLAGGTYIWAAPRAKSARIAWQSAGAYSDPIRSALSYAVLAPNPHNRQPWQVELLSDTAAVLYCDDQRRLPVTDPYDRQTTIGLGCFLELFVLAAQHNQYRAHLDLFPEGAHPKRLDSRPVARLKLTKAKQTPAPLFTQITQRHTDRKPYTSQLPSAQNLADLQLDAGPMLSSSQENRLCENLRNICADAARIEFMTPHTHAESVALMRVGRKAVRANPDGISIEGPFTELLNRAGAVSPQALSDHDSPAFKQGLKMYLDGIETGNSFFWITTPDNQRTDQIAAGRAYARANLKASALGLSVHPLSQALQEYPEMSEQFAKIHKTLSIQSPARLQILARVGYGRANTRSPRWPLENRLI